MPAVHHGLEGRRLEWRPPVYNTIHHILCNPIYAGAYAYGRSASKTRIANGRKQIVRGFRVERSDWEVLIRDHHEGYIGWDAFRNQRLINDNANGESLGEPRRGAAGRGFASRAVPLRPLRTQAARRHSGTKGDVARYHCRGALINHGAERCISFGSFRVDSAVAAEVIERIQPLGVEASLAALGARGREDAWISADCLIDNSAYGSVCSHSSRQSTCPRNSPSATYTIDGTAASLASPISNY